MTQSNELDNKIEKEVFMKGCYFFHGDVKQNTCFWSKNSVDKFDVTTAQKDGLAFWRTFIHPQDFFLFEKLLAGNRKQISGDFRCLNLDGTYQWMHCIMQVEENFEDNKYSGVMTDLVLGYSTKAVTRLRENNGFRLVLDKLSKENKAYGILIIGIDDFKNINEIYSYSLGDNILRLFAQKIELILESQASLYQLDGDSFGILYPDASLDDMKACFKAIRSTCQSLQVEDNLTISFTISGGISLFPEDGNDGETLYRNTRISFNEAKNRGKDQFVVFNQEISSTTAYQAKLMDSLRESVNHNFKGFSLVYQPIVYAHNDQLFGCEVLLRWHHPEFPNGLSPIEFIPLLEKSGLIIEVGKWIIDEALAQRKRWDTYTPNLQISINVAAQQFRDTSFIPFVMDTLEKYQLEPSSIILELTESGEIQDPDNINKIFEFFRSQRIRIALDDFGTGYDSLNCLRLLSSDVLKIDRSFLERITYNISDQKILHNIINLCNSMKIEVCIEGIETLQVRELTRQLGASLLQGYYYSRPLTALQFTEKFIKNFDTSKQNTLFSHTKGLTYSEIIPAQAMDMNEIVDYANAGIFQVGMDNEFTFLTCNEGYRRMLGYTAKEMEEKFANKALGFVHPEDSDFVNQEIRRQLGMGDTLISEFRIIRKDGSPLWVIGTGSVIRNAIGNPSIIVVIVDNDEAKKKAIQEHLDYVRYYNILNKIPGGVKCVRFDENFTIEYISPSFLSLLGFDEYDIKNRFDSKYINMVYQEDIGIIIGDLIEQLKTSNVVTLRYRSLCKDGNLIWVETVSRLYPPDADGIQRFYSSIINITDTLTDEEKQSSSNFKERYQLAAERWGDIFFQLDLKTKYLSFSDNYKHLLGRDCQQTLEDELNAIHPDDRGYFAHFIEQAIKGEVTQEIEVRIKDIKDNYVWCSVIFNEPERFGEKPIMLFGKINIIDDLKKERDELILKSQLDSLTNLLNKGTLEERIEQLLNKHVHQQHALFMLDLDDFKCVNDTYGHLFGDKLLIDIGLRLQKIFTVESVIGRAGGDEFIVCMPWDGNLTHLAKKGQQLLESLQQPFTFDNQTYTPKISIGISCYPKDGHNFYELFRKADSALYRVKLQNKNDFCIY